MKNRDMTIFLLLLIVSYVGIAIGMIISKRIGISSLSVADTIYNMKSTSISFMSVFSNGMLSNVCLYILLIFFGMMNYGLPICTALLLFKGYAIGFSCGGLCQGLGIKGILFAIFGILLPAAIMLCWFCYISNRIYMQKYNRKIRKSDMVYKALGEMMISIFGYSLCVCIQSTLQYIVFYII